MSEKKENKSDITRRKLLAGLAAGTAALALPLRDANASKWEEYFRQHFKRLSKEDLKQILADMSRDLSKEYDKDAKVEATPAMDGVIFAYALDVSCCIGCRKCVHACAKENNLSRNPEVHWIIDLKFKKNVRWLNFEEGERYYNPQLVPEKGHFYLPIQCQQCEKSPCEKVCPVGATWKEPDGIVVVDYNWCIGCRYCMAACPYGARHFNWGKPKIPKDELNPDMHYLGNRPQPKGAVGKCTWCIQRTRKGRYTACVEACPVGSRKFGNVMDSKSEIRYILENMRVFTLKEELGTHPKFFYYFSLGSTIKDLSHD